jgi:hypothetical protein
MRDGAFGDFSPARDECSIGGNDQRLRAVGSRGGNCWVIRVNLIRPG